MCYGNKSAVVRKRKREGMGWSGEKASWNPGLTCVRGPWSGERGFGFLRHKLRLRWGLWTFTRWNRHHPPCEPSLPLGSEEEELLLHSKSLSSIWDFEFTLLGSIKMLLFPLNPWTPFFPLISSLFLPKAPPPIHCQELTNDFYGFCLCNSIKFSTDSIFLSLQLIHFQPPQFSSDLKNRYERSGGSTQTQENILFLKNHVLQMTC